MPQSQFPDLTPSISPLTQWMGTQETGKDKDVKVADINFDKRIARESLPITRMIDPTGEVNDAAIMNARPYADPAQMWEQLNADMPRGRQIDPEAFKARYDQGQNQYNIALAESIRQMKLKGMSDKTVRRHLGKNPELREYVYRNNLGIDRKATIDWGAVGETVAKIAVPLGVSAYGARKITDMFQTPASFEASRGLKNLGYKRVKVDGKWTIQKMSRDELTKRFYEQELKGKKVRPGTRSIYPSSDSQAKAADVIAERGKGESRTMRRALKGDKGAVNRVMRDVPKYAGGKAGKIAEIAGKMKFLGKGGGRAKIAAIIGSAALWTLSEATLTKILDSLGGE